MKKNLQHQYLIRWKQPESAELFLIMRLKWLLQPSSLIPFDGTSPIFLILQVLS